MTRRGIAATGIWAILVAVAALIVTQARYTTDLSAFLPRSPTAMQRLLVDQLRAGLASRLILIGIEGGPPAERARISQELGRRLRASGLFVSVNNGDRAGVEREQALLFDHRYLLSESVTPARFTPTGLHAAIQESLDLLSSPAGLLLKSLLPRDPTGEMLQVIDQIGEQRQPASTDGAWSSRDGKRALLVAQTRAAGSDTDGQERAVEQIRRAFDAAAAAGGPAVPRDSRLARPALEMSGPGVFSVAARATIKHEVLRLSILSTTLIMLLLLAVYRSPVALLLGLIPVASGTLAGIAAVALAFGSVHGITLGFGVTLIGESVDYSIYLFVQSLRSTEAAGLQSDTAARARWQKSSWPTIRLGVLTSIAGFASLLPSGFPGLAQLGMFSISGLVTAALVTRFVLPSLLPARLHISNLVPLGEACAAAMYRLRALRPGLLVLPLLAAAALYTHWGSTWNRELSALSPVSASDQALDARLRTDIGAPDVRALIVISGTDRETLLRASESISARLDRLVDENVIAGFVSPSRYLPSLASQRARQESLPPRAELERALQTALSGLPLRSERLQAFIGDVEAARSQPLMTRRDLEGTSLAAGVDALLQSDGQRWSALLPLRARDTVAIDLARVHSGLAGAMEGAGVQAVVLDVKAEVDRLYSSYLTEVVRLSLAGFAAIVVLLLIALGSASRVVRVVAPLALAVLTVMAGLLFCGVQLTILHLIGMLLIVAVGSNYALFFDRPVSTDQPTETFALTLASLVVANSATVLGFGALAFSSVPVLSALGSTVAPGALLALLFSATLARDIAGPARTR